MDTQELTDHYAGLAMHAILTNQQMVEAVTKMGTQAVDYDEALNAIAGKAFNVAGAMMRERAERRRENAAETAFKPDTGIV